MKREFARGILGTLLPGILGCLLLVYPAMAQVQQDTIPPEAPPAQEEAEEEAPRGISPRGAFLRSALIPGWGHTKVGSYVRGAFYFTTQSATAFMLFKTNTRMARAEDRTEMLEAALVDSLAAAGVTDLLEVEQALADDPEVADARGLVETRDEQREDWLALGVFLLFLGGADAYVAAHLADFPATVEIEPGPQGGLEVAITVPLSFPFN